MAVAVQPYIYTKPGMWNSGNPRTTLSNSGSDAAQASVAHRYPPGGLEVDSPSSMLPRFHHLPVETLQQPNSPALSKPPSPTIRKRGNLGSIKSSKIKRSMSTPNVRGQATADAAALALSAEKRRNKLGYHRTSVACGHCRRRKIRCIPAPADPQNRCSNCIRLKKECNFYPVDQQPPLEPARKGSKAHSGTGRASESSSPSTSSGHLPEMQPTLPYPQLTMPPIQDLGGPQMKRQRTESFSPETKVVTSSRSFDYNQSHSDWMAPDASPGTKPPPDVPQSFWRGNPQESPMTSAFSPFAPSLHIPPHQNWPSSHAEPSPRDELSWSLPQRSISYSNLEGLQSHHHQYSQYPPPNPQHHPGDQYTSKSRILQSGMYPPQISTISGHPPTTGGETSQHSHSAGALPPGNYSQWQQPYSYQKPVGSSSEQYGSWNNSQGGQQHPGENSQGAGYGYGVPTTGAYYPPPPHPGR